MEPGNEVIIAGGGLAGLTCALHLLKAGIKVTVIEKNGYPQHKVCGEYISNEVLPYLKWLGADPVALQPTHIDRLAFSSVSGKLITCALPLGGFGVSRFALDDFLCKKVKALGGSVLRDTVDSIIFKDDFFEVQTHRSGILRASLVIGAYGKRAILDQKLSRPFIKRKSGWLAVKGHYLGEFPDDLVGLHNFKGGYCGVSKVEGDRINICYLTDYEHFKAFKNIQAFQQQVVYQNPHLKEIFEKSTALFEHPLTISQVSFAQKEPVYAHILMIGDTAGLIHPLCGNGMAMAVHSAKIAAELVVDFLSGTLPSRKVLEEKYRAHWNKTFRKRLFIGRLISSILRKERIFPPLLNLLIKFPNLLPLIIKSTHGKPIT